MVLIQSSDHYLFWQNKMWSLPVQVNAGPLHGGCHNFDLQAIASPLQWHATLQELSTLYGQKIIIVLLQDVCAAAIWVSPCTLSRFHKINIAPLSGMSVEDISYEDQTTTRVLCSHRQGYFIVKYNVNVTPCDLNPMSAWDSSVNIQNLMVRMGETEQKWLTNKIKEVSSVTAFKLFWIHA